jgi:tetratricopeptide (TPR) repeat protein
MKYGANQLHLRECKFSCLLLSLAFCLQTNNLAWGHSFSHAKKVYVPASLIDRRVDYDLFNEKTATSSSANSTNLNKQHKVYKGHIDAGTDLSNAYKQKLSQASIVRANTFLRNHDLNSAIKSARQAVSFNPNNKQAQDLLNRLLAQTGINPRDVKARLKMAQELAMKGQLDEAYIEYTSLLKLQPKGDDAFNVHLGLADLAVKTGSKQLAFTEYEKAIELNPKSVYAYRQLGLLKYAEADLRAANTNLSKALMLNQHDEPSAKTLLELWQKQVAKLPTANSHMGLARAYQLVGDLPAAQNEYRQAAHLDPNHPHLPAARQSFKHALSKQEAERLISESNNLSSQGMYKEAYDKMRQANQLNPFNIQAHISEGDLAQKIGLFPEAKKAYLNGLKHAPEDNEIVSKIQELSKNPLLIVAAPQVAPQLIATSQPVAAIVSPADLGKKLFPSITTSLPSSEPLTNISNFSYSLRNYMLIQKDQLAQAESSTQRFLRDIVSAGKGESNEESLASAADLTNMPVLREAISMPDVKIPDIEKTLSKAKLAMAAAMPEVAPDPLPRIKNIATAPNIVKQNRLLNTSTVNLQLKAVKPKNSGVDLIVALRNDSDSELKLPNKMKAIIRGSDMKKSIVKVYFDNNKVLPHTETEGIISVPFDKVDSKADLSIPDLLPQGIASNRDIHLTTSIAAKQQILH